MCAYRMHSILHDIRTDGINDSLSCLCMISITTYPMCPIGPAKVQNILYFHFHIVLHICSRCILLRLMNTSFPFLKDTREVTELQMEQNCNHCLQCKSKCYNKAKTTMVSYDGYPLTFNRTIMTTVYTPLFTTCIINIIHDNKFTNTYPSAA